MFGHDFVIIMSLVPQQQSVAHTVCGCVCVCRNKKSFILEINFFMLCRLNCNRIWMKRERERIKPHSLMRLTIISSGEEGKLINYLLIKTINLIFHRRQSWLKFNYKLYFFVFTQMILAKKCFNVLTFSVLKFASFHFC